MERADVERAAAKKNGGGGAIRRVGEYGFLQEFRKFVWKCAAMTPLRVPCLAVRGSGGGSGREVTIRWEEGFGRRENPPSGRGQPSGEKYSEEAGTAVRGEERRKGVRSSRFGPVKNN